MKQVNLPDCTTSTKRPFGCMELWAGNEKAHRALNLAGLEGDVIALPRGAKAGATCTRYFRAATTSRAWCWRIASGTGLKRRP
jgi:hypothetical protein